MSSNPVPGGPPPSVPAPTQDADTTRHRAGPSWPPALSDTRAPASVRFSSVSNRLDGGLHLGEDRSPPPGRLAVVMAALTIGLLLMGTQLWLLTVGLELHLAGQGRQVWLLAAVSGAIFAGGVMMLRLLGRRPRLDR